jgi:hypothetical protein
LKDAVANGYDIYFSKLSEYMRKGKTPRHSTPISLGDRFTTAVMSGIFAGITLIAYFFIAHSWSSTWNLKFYFFRDIFSSDVCLYIIGISTLVGFVLGPIRMGNVFGFFWGSND